MSKVFDFVKPGVITGDDVQKVFAVAKEKGFAIPAVRNSSSSWLSPILKHESRASLLEAVSSRQVRSTSGIAARGSSLRTCLRSCRRAGWAASGFEVTTHGGRRPAGRDAIEWVREAADRGIGEVLLNSMDADGTTDGFDIEMIRAVRQVVDVPLIASGGAGTATHFVEAARAGADAVLAASVFHYGRLTIVEVKQELAAAGFEVRGV